MLKSEMWDFKYAHANPPGRVVALFCRCLTEQHKTPALQECQMVDYKI